MASSYNNSAWFYDGLSRLVYGRALINAQVYLLQFVPAGSAVLIVGGGTGWILEELTKIHSSGLQITYVEVAADMMVRSRQRDIGRNEVAFVNGAVEDVTFSGKFDVVITPFLFDNFLETTAGNVFKHIHNSLRTNSVWLITDFQYTGKWWQKILLKSMFLFFKTLCGIEASSLPDVRKYFDLYGYKLIIERAFYGKFIISSAYKSSLKSPVTSNGGTLPSQKKY